MQGFEKYNPPDYPPNYSPAEQRPGGLNSYRGQHAPDDRARMSDQGIQITQFELPFDIWCGSCSAHIGMGARYNAEKREVGMYYSTPIYSFRCKCHHCGGGFEINTAPTNAGYVVASGARQQDENGGYGAPHPSTAPPHLSQRTTDTNGRTAGTYAQTNATYVQAPRFEPQYNANSYEYSRRVDNRFESGRVGKDEWKRERKRAKEQREWAKEDEKSRRPGLVSTVIQELAGHAGSSSQSGSGPGLLGRLQARRSGRP
ncbi:DUF572-domain-containing protein [Auriscalpium vulgare]|uniref:DUF572-domain-containing protein n=1 Tax=Auriscalpium vulgare TaxID=40419 RepID=A0ACB8RXL7_9AGAM|nr:DUF572-domain-containing protein [Auriscalpium vulgare]